MPRVKNFNNIVVVYGATGYCIHDAGETKSPRFILFNEKDNEVILKTNDPRECHKWIKKNIWWKKEN